jgi:hypothetical protein
VTGLDAIGVRHVDRDQTLQNLGVDRENFISW